MRLKSESSEKKDNERGHQDGEEARSLAQVNDTSKVANSNSCIFPAIAPYRWEIAWQ